MTILIRQSPMMVDQYSNLSIGRQQERGSFACFRIIFFTSRTHYNRTDGHTSEKFVSRDFELHQSLFVLTARKERNRDEAHLSVESVCRCLSCCWKFLHTVFCSLLCTIALNAKIIRVVDNGPFAVVVVLYFSKFDDCARLGWWQLLQTLLLEAIAFSSSWQETFDHF